MFLGWDIGIKNLSYCVIDFNKETQDYKIIDWNIINLTQEHNCEEKLCNCIIKSSQKICNKKAIYCDKNNYYCKTHSKKLDINKIKEIDYQLKCQECNKPATRFINSTKKYVCLKHFDKCLNEYEYDKVNTKNVAKKPIINLGYVLFEELKKYPCFLDCEYVIIENQPVLKNPTMKSIQMMLYSFFLMKGICEKEKNKIKSINFCAANNKLKVYDGPKLNELDKIKNKYTKNKKAAIIHCEYFLQKEDNKWLDFFKQHSKKDDLADSYLMTRYFIKKLKQ